MKPDYGRSELMVLAAFRYCLGRRTYIVGDCADWLIRIWPEIEQHSKDLIRKELEEAFEYDAKHSQPEEYKRLGDSCDRQQWERVRKLYA